MKKRFKNLTIALSSSLFVMLTVCMLSTNGQLISNLNSDKRASDEYTLTLDKNNSYKSGSSQEIYTDSGNWKVTFDYSDASSYSNGHVTLSDGGTISNKEHVKSISYLQVDYSGSGYLTLKTAFSSTAYGNPWNVSSGFCYSLPSHPYFAYFTAVGTVNIEKIAFQYTCEDNPQAEPRETDPYYQLVTNKTDIKSGDIVYVVGNEDDEDNYCAMKNEAQSSSLPWYIKGQSIEVSEGKTTSVATEWTVTKSGDNYIFTNATTDLYGYIDGTHYSLSLGSGKGGTNLWNWTIVDSLTGKGTLVANPSSKVYLSFSSSHSNFSGCSESTFNDNNVGIFLYKKVTPTEYDVPKDLVGFSAVDANKDKYDTDSVYNTDNGLTVTALYSDGSSNTVSKDKYTYKVSTDKAGTSTIDVTKPFPAEGKYYVTISYGDFIPSIIELDVGKAPAKIVNISASLSTSEYKTSDTITLTSNLTADLVYDDESELNNVPYVDFSKYGLTTKLLDPNGVEKELTSILSTVGTWKVRVSCSTSVYDEVDVNVSAVEVISISLNETSHSMYVGDTLQLSVTFNPTTSFDKTITWSTSDETLATVSNDGLVTAVKAGTPIITATTVNGKTATCSLTISKKSVQTATILSKNTAKSGASVSLTKSSFTTQNITLTSVSSSSIFGTSDSSFKVSSSNNSGSITLSFASCLISGVTLSAAYANDENANVRVTTSANTTGQTKSLTSSTKSDVKFDAFDSETKESTSITISSAKKNRFYLYGITLTIGANEPVYPTAISLPTSSEVSIGNSLKLTPTFTPSNANQTDTTWSSGDTSIATVSNGVVTGVKEGATTISATVKNEAGDNLTATTNLTVSKISVTGVTLSNSSIEVKMTKTATLTANVLPSNASNKNVSWSTSNSAVATVNNGVVTGVSEGSATITVKTEDGGYTATCNVSVTEGIASWTVMIYMCGSDLESENGLATSDLSEILSVANQPDDVNIIIETGGASSWKSTYGISSSYLQRWHVANKKLVKDANVTKANMGLSSTFESFLEWGLTEYPATKTGVVLWNHGGGMHGVCYDENYSDDSLENKEVSTAISNAFRDTSTSGKLEFIGYDACLMQLQDVAEFNSKYFKYMVGSEESESGYGWDYDTWIDDLYKSTSTTELILKAIVDGFITSMGGTSSSDNQTLSYLDLSYMSAYLTAWENMSSAVSDKVTSSSRSSFCSLVNGCKYYGDEDYTYFCMYDAKDFVNKLAKSSSFNPGSSYTDAVLTAHANLVKYSVVQKGAGNSYGLAMFFIASNAYASYAQAVYTSTATNFSSWRALMDVVGYL